MSILDTFYILFKTDADEAVKDIKEVDKASDQAAAGLNKMDAAAGKLGSSFVAMARNLAAPLVALASVGTITAAVFNRIQEIDEIGDMAGKLRTSATDYEAFTRAVRASGGTLQDAANNLATFNDKLNDAAARPDSINAKNFAKWGIVFKDVNGEALGAVDGILSLAKSLEGISQAEALGRLRRLGIEDADTIAFLLQGKKAIEEKMQAEREAGVVTERQIQIVGEYQSAMGRLRNILDSAANMLTEMVVPALTRAIEAFSSFVGWVSRNGTLVQGFFIGVAGVITAAYLPAIVAAATATLVAIAPFIAIAAAIAAVGAAFALAYEDVLAFLNGQPSLIGALAEKYEWFGELIRGIGEAYRALKAGGVAAIDGIVAVWDMLSDRVSKNLQILLDFWSSVEPIWAAFKDALSAIGELLSAIGKRVAEDLASAFAKFGERFSEIKARASEMFAAFLDDIRPVTDAVGVAAAAIRDGFTGAFNAVMEVWNATVGRIAGLITGIAEKIRGLSAGIRGAGEAAPTAANDNAASAGSTIGALIRGQNAVAASSGAAVNGQTSASLPSGATVTNTSNVSVGAVTVNTQATDAKGVATAVKGELQRQLRGTAAQFDDGVDR